jgi:hypothetical protein
MYSIRILLSQPLRFLLTIGGIGLCIVLILFLLGVYRGVEVGSVEYIRKNKTDLWVLQSGTNNILRATSILSTSHGYVIRSHVPIIFSGLLQFFPPPMDMLSGAIPR